MPRAGPATCGPASGVRIVTLAEGEIGELHVGLKGTMNALFLRDLAQKTRRGLEGRVRQGRSGGGLCFGYDVVRDVDARGEPVRGGRKINEAEAAVVRRIFEEYADGCSPRAIARRLNADGVPGPFGGAWSPSTLHGNVGRGTGILNNELYIGRLVWNRLRYVKDPNTGKRRSRANHQDAHIVQNVPELRIVDDALVARGCSPLRQGPEERQPRRGSDRRGSHTADHALRRADERGAVHEPRTRASLAAVLRQQKARRVFGGLLGGWLRGEDLNL